MCRRIVPRARRASSCWRGALQTDGGSDARNTALSLARRQASAVRTSSGCRIRKRVGGDAPLASATSEARLAPAVSGAQRHARSEPSGGAVVGGGARAQQVGGARLLAREGAVAGCVLLGAHERVEVYQRAVRRRSAQASRVRATGRVRCCLCPCACARQGGFAVRCAAATSCVLALRVDNNKQRQAKHVCVSDNGGVWRARRERGEAGAGSQRGVPQSGGERCGACASAACGIGG